MPNHYNAGEKHGRHKLTAAQVSEIREYFSVPREFRPGSKTMAQVAAFAGVSTSTIRKIVEKKTWAGTEKIITPKPKDNYSQEKDNSH